jgi:16S rRNA (cytosine967-C5)-methyltransferase
MDELGVKELGEKVWAEIAAQNQPAKVVLRVKHLKLLKKPESNLNGFKH